MIKYFLSILIILNTSYGQDLQQQINILNAKFVAAQKSDSFKIARLQRADSLNLIVQQNQAQQISYLRVDSIKKSRDIISLQRTDSLYRVYFTTQTNQILGLITTTNVQAKQIADLQKINTLSSVGSLSLVRIGTLAYQLRQDSATKLREGNLTAYKWGQIQIMDSKITTVYNKLFPVTTLPPPQPSNPPPIGTEPIPTRVISHPKFFPNSQ